MTSKPNKIKKNKKMKNLCKIIKNPKIIIEKFPKKKRVTQKIVKIKINKIFKTQNLLGNCLNFYYFISINLYISQIFNEKKKRTHTHIHKLGNNKNINKKNIFK